MDIDEREIFCVHPSHFGFSFYLVFLPLSCPCLSDVAFSFSRDNVDMQNDVGCPLLIITAARILKRGC